MEWFAVILLMGKHIGALKRATLCLMTSLLEGDQEEVK
jgi:hypothetical protein